MGFGKTFKIITGFLIIVAISIMSLSGVKKVDAQYWDLGSGTNVSYESSGEGSSGYYNTGSGYSSGSGSTSTSAYIETISPLVSALPGCTSAVGKGIKNLFGGGSGSSSTTNISSLSDELRGMEGPTMEGSSLSDIADETTNQLESVETYDKTANTKLDTLLGDTAEIKTSTNALDTNQNCLNAIGKAIIKILIQEMTSSIVSWIQGGNDGGPMFVTDPGKFFEDIAKKQILSFGLEINNPDKYPFGKAFMQNVANSYNRKFADNAQYSLNEMIKSTSGGNYAAIDFTADFSKGGWGAWEAMTQVPANNPLGFQLMASNELGKRISGTDPSEAETKKSLLEQANGWLGDERCTDPWGVTKEENAAYLNGDTVNGKECNKWEYVTPGAVVGHALTKSMDDSTNSLLDAETLNDAISAILDAALARLSNETIGVGLANVSTDITGANYNISSGATDTGTQFAGSYTTQWIKDNPDFNLETDLTQAFIDQQRTYSDKLNSYNDALAELTKWIRQLDYCIPGPNPDWEDVASATINGTGDPKTKYRWWNSETALMAQSYLDPSGIFNYIGNLTVAEDAKKAAASYLTNILGVHIYSGQDQVNDQAGIISVLTNLLNNYKKVVNDIYFSFGVNTMNGIDTSTYMPGVTLEARAQFKKIAGYEKIIKNNTEEVIFRKSIITRLESFKQKIDNGTITSADLDNPLSQAVTEFARLSAYFVSGDDIGEIDDLYKEALDEKTYVKSDLLQGDFGCEKFLSNLWTNNRFVYNKYVNREPYPLEIKYFYGIDNNNSNMPGSYNYYYNPYISNNEVPWNQSTLTSALQPVGSGLGFTEIRQGFLYGSMYYNNWAAPLTPSYSSNTGLSQGCVDKWIHDVSLTASNSKGATLEPDNPDLGGLEIAGDPNGNGAFKNICGVVLNFERNFGIY